MENSEKWQNTNGRPFSGNEERRGQNNHFDIKPIQVEDRSVRTTISIQDALLQQAKEVAHQRQCTLGDVIEAALVQSLPELKSIKQQQNDGWTTFNGNGLMPGVNLDSNADLLEVMDDE